MVYLEQNLLAGGHCSLKSVSKISYQKRPDLLLQYIRNKTKRAKILTSASQKGFNLFFMHTEVVYSPNIIGKHSQSPIIM